ncbi:MAG: transcriptional regulator [Flavobacteriales bacterium]|nr:transcriptional regulator [Flavobacteriales bacterium]
MKNKRSIPLPIKQRRLLQQVGEQIKLARLRRKYSLSLVAERAGIAISTLELIEKGAETVGMGKYLMTLHALGLADDLLLVAKDDELGRKIQDAELTTSKRAPKRKK